MTVADFEAETGIGVVYDLYASSEEAQAKMLAGSTGYDVVLQSGLGLNRFIETKVFQPLDRAKLPGWSNLDATILKIIEGFGPSNLYRAPYMWGSAGFTYNMDMVKARLPNADLQSLDTLMTPENAAALADCGISILDSPTDAGFMIMKYLGIDPDTAGPAEYKKLAEAMAPIRKYIATFDNSNYLTALPNGEVCAVNDWSGDYSVAKTRATEAGIKINLAYFVPKTGSPAWFDLLCVPTDAPNVDSAYKFIDYLLRPQVIAACTNFTGYANANKAATEFVDKTIARDPAVYPDVETLNRMYTPKQMSEAQESALTRIWTEIKSGG